MPTPVRTGVLAKARLVASAIALIAAISGCGGSGGAGPASPPPSGGGNPPPPPPPPQPGANGDTGGGIWSGVLTREGEILNYGMCLLVEAGELACFLVDPEAESLDYDETVASLHGTVQISATTPASGSGSMYASPGQVLSDGTSVVADFTITSGALSNANRQIELNLSMLGAETTFHGSYDYIYATLGDAFLWEPIGVFTGFEIHGDPASLTIYDDHTLFMQSASGCTGNGHLINIEPNHVSGTGGYNAYTVDLTIEGCADLNGTYEGLATLVEFAFENGSDRLVMAMFNDTNAIVDDAWK